MIMCTPFIVSVYQGGPAIFDTVARVWYFGFRTMRAARERADQLNKGA